MRDHLDQAKHESAEYYQRRMERLAREEEEAGVVLPRARRRDDPEWDEPEKTGNQEDPKKQA